MKSSLLTAAGVLVAAFGGALIGFYLWHDGHVP